MSEQTLHLTDQQVRDGLNKAVEEKGADYRYQNEFDDDNGCVNFVDGKPACIAGNVYSQHGVTVLGDGPFDVWESSTVGCLTDSHLESGTGNLYHPLSFESKRGEEALKIAQRWQDAGHTWGESRDAAFRFLDGDDTVDVFPLYVLPEVR